MTSKIEWTDETWNPVTGCTKVSAGCANCYAERMWPRLRTGRPFTEVHCHPERLEQPLHWRKPRKVFVCSMGDLFHPDVPDEFIAAVFGVMAATPQHTYQIPTKRPDRMLAWFGWAKMKPDFDERAGAPAPAVGYLYEYAIKATQGKVNGFLHEFPAWPLPNVWLLVSVEDQATADERIPLLFQTPAAVRGVSLEPMLGSVDLSRWLWPACWHWDARYRTPEEALAAGAMAERRPQGLVSAGARFIDWVIVGGESGPKARPMHPDWARSVRDQCVAADVAFFFKQWGEWGQADSIEDLGTAHHGWWEFDSCDGGVPRQDCGGVPREVLYRVGKRHAGRELDGRTWEQYPVGGKSDD